MKSIKWLLLAILVLTLTAGLAIQAQAAEAVASGTCGDNLTWTLDSNGTLTISGTGSMYGYYYYDYSYGGRAPWVDYRFSITSIIIQNGVTSIGKCAFSGCTNLVSVTIPDSVTKLDISAFNTCTSLTSVTIPDRVTSIGDSAFYKCRSLTSVTIPNSVVSIGYSAFNTCTSLTSVTIPNSVTSIGDSAFVDCSSLTSVNIPNSITSIGSCIFLRCRSLTSITIPNSVTSIGIWAFLGCSSLTDITIPNSVTSIGISAFSGCSGVTSITIPNSVTSIGESAFSKCSSVTSITIPDSVTSIEEEAFSYCSSLTEIKFKGNAPSFGSDVFLDVTAMAYYPFDNATWAAYKRQNYGGSITWVDYDPLALPVPDKPYKIVNVVSGIHVYWKDVKEAKKYGIWRSETGKNGTYKWIANPTVPHFTDTNVESGKTYFYKVTAMNVAGKHTNKSEAVGITFVETPDITSRFNKAGWIALGWNRIEGASGYAVYRKSYAGSDDWVRVATIQGGSNLTWTDTTVKNNNGTAYKYAVRALVGSNLATLSGCRSAGRSMVRLTSRALTGAEKAGLTSIKCKWTTSSAVTGYEVRFMVGSQVFRTFVVGNPATGVKTFAGLPARLTYKVQVRSYKKIDGMSFYSAWSTAEYVTL